MKGSKLLQIGISLVLAIVTVVGVSGFQAATVKIGVVDITSVVEKSDFGTQKSENYKALQKAREGLLEFIDTYRVLTTDQAIELRDLTLKETPTDPEKARLETLKAEIIATDKKSRELATKANMTPEERTLVEEYARRAQAMADVQTRWFREFSSQLQDWSDKQKLVGLQKARDAIKEVAKAQGFTVVLEVGIAPYGADDLTDAALAAMNAKK